MPKPIGVIVSIRVEPGRATEQVDLFSEIAPLVRAEPGCVTYELHTVAGDPDRFVILEWWESSDALAAHDEMPHMVAADARTPAFRDGSAHVTLVDQQAQISTLRAALIAEERSGNTEPFDLDEFISAKI